MERQDTTARPAARALAAVGLGSGALTVLSTVLPAPPGFDVVAVRVVGGATVAIALLVLVLPWHRLPRRAAWVLVPVALGLISWHNAFGGVDAFRYGIFYVAVFCWVGLFLGRGAALAAAPLAAVSYVAPLLLAGLEPWAVATVAYALPLYVGAGEALAWRSAALDRTEQRLRHLAEHDGLTGLAQRPVLVREAARAAERGAVGVVFVDVDDFKAVNDVHGHAAGDEVLRRVAATVSAAVREGDLVARLSGDEFAVLLPDVGTGSQLAEDVAQRVLAALRGVEVPGGGRVAASAGVAVGTESDVDVLLRRADAAMYAAKRAGKDGLAVAAP